MTVQLCDCDCDSATARLCDWTRAILVGLLGLLEPLGLVVLFELKFLRCNDMFLLVNLRVSEKIKNKNKQ